jgi:radical SAM superfamily enzyme YgiQ (UPF0313 family)
MRILFCDIGEIDYKGVELLSAVLKRNGHKVDLLLDPGLGKHYYLKLPFLNKIIKESSLIDAAIAYQPDLIAMSIVTNNFLLFKEFATKLKTRCDIPIIVGGIHPTSLPEEVIKEDWVDMLCIGDGEEAILELVNRISLGKTFTDIRNLWVKDKHKKIHKNQLRPLEKNLDNLPFPDLSLYNQYGVLGKRMRFMTARGCIHQCSFCVNSFRNDLYPKEQYLRKRSVANVITELKDIKSIYKPKAIRFEDDVFVTNKKWLKEFKHEYSTHIKLPFHCYITPLGVNEETIKDLKECGCNSIAMGIQSGSKDIRSFVMNRKYSNEKVVEASKIIKKYGIKLYAEYMFGVPDEKPEDMWQTLDLSVKIKAHNSWASIFYPYPKTQLASYAFEKGLINNDNISDLKVGKGNPHSISILLHPYAEEALKFKILLPIYSMYPIFRNIIRKLIIKKYGKIHKFIYIISIPLLEKGEFYYRFIRLPKIIFKTKKKIKNLIRNKK